jgi:hypothetical protein
MLRGGCDFGDQLRTNQEQLLRGCRCPHPGYGTYHATCLLLMAAVYMADAQT